MRPIAAPGKMRKVVAHPSLWVAAILAPGATILLAAVMMTRGADDHALTSAGVVGMTGGVPANLQQSEGVGPILTEENLRVAFIGDTAMGSNFTNVLNMIEAESADLIIHEGDFDYTDDPDAFFAAINAAIGPNYPYLMAVGNHDIASWPGGCSDPDGCYANLFKQRMAATGLVPDDPNLNDDMYSLDFQGLGLVFTGQTTAFGGDCPSNPNGYACYIRNQLSGDRHIWKFCNWHKNQQAMQIGGKTDEVGWDPYNTCVELGAIIATGHEHSYERTKTLTDPETQTVDLVQHPLVDGTPSNPNALRVMPGASFVFVSGLGGNSMRPQLRCLPATYPYGCNKEWASIYTTNQTSGVSRYGALFIDFYVDGDPYKARGYFKTTTGAIIDQFEITAGFQDSDGDGIQDSLDNCVAWSNPTQAMPEWPVPSGDSDCDGWRDTQSVPLQASEAAIGTNAGQHCAANRPANNEGTPDAWPVDFNDNQLANGQDWLQYNTRLGTQPGDQMYSIRHDLNANNFINGADLLLFNPFFNKFCA